MLELLADLCARAPVPGVMLERDDRFPSDAVLNAELDAIAAAWRRKRARSVARVWPFLGEFLGDDLDPQFAAYAAAFPLLRHGGALADGRTFARWLAASSGLPDAVRLQMLAVDLRYAASSDGLRVRRWPSARIVLLTRARRLIVALRAPRVGEFWRSFSLQWN